MLNRSRYEQIGELHASAIDQGFLSTLGAPFLSLLYEAMDEAQDTFVIVEEQDGKIVGFVSGGVGMGPTYKRLLAHPIRLIKSLLPSALNPKGLIRMLEIVFRGAVQSGLEELPDAELMSLAVQAEYRGEGVAAGLYEQLQDRFQSIGVDEFKIVVGQDLRPAHRFYARMGATAAARVEIHRGAISVVYVHELQQAIASQL